MEHENNLQPAHYVVRNICILLKLSVLGLCLRIIEFGLFGWISLTALSRINESGLFAWISLTALSRINESGLFAWISLTALSRTYFIIEQGPQGTGGFVAPIAGEGSRGTDLRSI